MTSQRTILRRFRRITTVVALLGLAYLVMRFDLVRLPAEICCPLTRYEPGDQLIVDGRPSRLTPGDAVFIRTRSGKLHLTRVEAVREADGALWCATDNPDCPGFGSSEAGWVVKEAVAGRVLLSWEY